ncbi:hypothetical protein B0O99DRAFT_400121 [Bisporella sp. PMI_857]|nr:hypothetical protein B0O99DRAFT_400121 [Bisporella sp. PMI_857]
MITEVENFTVEEGMPDFCIQKDLCKHLQRMEHMASRHLGYLERSKRCKHVVYMGPAFQSGQKADNTKSSPVSLTQLMLSKTRTSQDDGFLQYERLRLARQLAATVLQFHTTPLLNKFFQGDDVIFFDTNGSTSSLTIPHLNVPVREIVNGQAPTAAKVTDPDPDASTYLISNQYMFRLGVIMIELAYQTPLSSLRQPQDSASSFGNQATDILTAFRVSNSMESKLGGRYAKIVKKCLRCNFGEDATDLDHPGLQAAFYRDVVSELEVLENTFEKLHLGT